MARVSYDDQTAPQPSQERPFAYCRQARTCGLFAPFLPAHHQPGLGNRPYICFMTQPAPRNKQLNVIAILALIAGVGLAVLDLWIVERLYSGLPTDRSAA